VSLQDNAKSHRTVREALLREAPEAAVEVEVLLDSTYSRWESKEIHSYLDAKGLDSRTS
jgi:hypothetical protein